MTPRQLEIMRTLLTARADEILNYDMDEPDAQETLDAIAATLETLEKIA